MKVFKATTDKFTGTKYHDVYPKAFGLYKQIKARTKRRPYIRSAYFKKDKIFLGPFWQHLKQKNWRDRTRRLKYFPCGIELIKNSKFIPISKENPNDPNEILHRFAGITPDHDLFFVQIKENKTNDQKILLSIFPEEK
jgi:hypothetical protein